MAMSVRQSGRTNRKNDPEKMTVRERVASCLGWGLKLPNGKQVYVIRGVCHHKVIVERVFFDTAIDQYTGIPISEFMGDRYEVLSPPEVEDHWQTNRLRAAAGL